MNYSEHFNLNLVEGTDIVNPLVQDVPNYQTIDAQMYANQSASVGTATELLSGTIHAITRTNPNTSVFRFTATARYAYGDTFTVDGASVTAVLPNGTSLPDGAYIVGGSVVCVLVGTLLTVLSVATTASNSARLGGNLPAYYATAQSLATYKETNDTAVANLTEDVDALSLKTGTVTWKGITFSFYKVGRLVLVTAMGTVSEELATNSQYEEVIVAPAGFKPLYNRAIYVCSGGNKYLQFATVLGSGVRVGYAHNLSTNTAINYPAGQIFAAQLMYVCAAE